MAMAAAMDHTAAIMMSDMLQPEPGCSDDVQWFLAQLKPNARVKATQNLERQGFAVFCPMVQETARSGDRFKSGPRALFPGYLFTAFSRENPQWRKVNSTYGVARLVQFNDAGPRPVPRGLIEELARRCDDSGLIQVPQDTFAPGDKVRPRTGPFTDFVAQVERIEPDRRVWLLFDMLGQKTRVQIPAENLERT